MNKDTFFHKLKIVEEKSHLENAYSHVIYQLFDIVLGDEYQLVDVSSLKRQENRNVAPDDLIAVPDFVVTDKAYRFEKMESSHILGCIEVKYHDKDVTEPTRLTSVNGKKGYKETYNNKVIYTNGWIWNCWIDDKNDTIDFRKEENQTNKKYGELLNYLCSIEWASEKTNGEN